MRQFLDQHRLLSPPWLSHKVKRPVGHLLRHPVGAEALHAVGNGVVWGEEEGSALVVMRYAFELDVVTVVKLVVNDFFFCFHLS